MTGGRWTFIMSVEVSCRLRTHTYVISTVPEFCRRNDLDGDALATTRDLGHAAVSRVSDAMSRSSQTPKNIVEGT